jgi:hypothetical protein
MVSEKSARVRSHQALTDIEELEGITLRLRHLTLRAPAWTNVLAYPQFMLDRCYPAVVFGTRCAFREVVPVGTVWTVVGGGTFWSIIGGAFFSLLIAIGIENLRRPRLRLEAVSTFHVPDTPIHAVRVRVHNKPLPFWFMVRLPALQCRATVRFLSCPGDKDIFNKTLEGRWVSSPEPNRVQGMVVIPQFRGVDIYPGEHELLDVAIRYEGETVCYFWNTESYLFDPLGKNPDWALPQQAYTVEVVVTSSGQKRVGKFDLGNTSRGADAFRLEPIK